VLQPFDSDLEQQFVLIKERSVGFSLGLSSCERHPSGLFARHAGSGNRTAYAATKAAMVGLARTWALELAVHGITTNVVAPGPIAETQLFHEIIPADSPKIPAIIQSIPVGRLGQPEDIARAILFFASEDAGCVTGQTLFVCGGTSVGSIVY
jgi:NAD(P)-dependent dehydrogenase (short-subunit alcohol dehydrogenase family)